VVAGRHVKAFELLDVLLGAISRSTMPQRSYQRALSVRLRVDSSPARDVLKRSSLQRMRRRFGARAFSARLTSRPAPSPQISTNEGARTHGQSHRGHWRGIGRQLSGGHREVGANIRTQGFCYGRIGSNGRLVQARLSGAARLVCSGQTWDRIADRWPRTILVRILRN